MSLTVTALVIGGNAEYLDETLFGLESQSRKPERVLVGCSDDEQVDIATRHNFPHLKIEGSFQEKLNTLVAAVEKPDWYWILFADSCPDPSTLERLSLTAETSPSASVVAPKLVDWEHPDKFISFGKSITQSGESFELVDAEIDQGQHDLLRDVLAADFAGGLIKQEALVEFIDSNSPKAALSTVFGIEQWLSGRRVLVEPKAKVRLSDKHGIDGEKHLAGKYFARRFADYHLSLITLPRVLALVVWLLIPITSIVRSFWLVGSRRVRYFFPELAAGFGAFLSVPNHLGNASRLRKTGRLRSISQLRVDRTQIRDRARRRFSELPPAEYRPGLLSGPWAWLIPAVLLLNYRLFPAGEAVTGGNFLPLPASWLELATNGWRSVEGFPIDALVFPLSIISALSFWAPSAAIGWFVFIAPAIAFAGAWLALARLSDNRGLITVLGLSYAISPIYAIQNMQPDISVTITYALLGWLVHGLIMILQSYVSSRAWRWTAWSGFLLAIIVSSYPALLLVLLPMVFLLMIFNLKRAGFLVFVPVLGALLLWPQISYWLISPLTIFAPLGNEFAYSNLAQWNLLVTLPLLTLFLAAFVSFLISPNRLALVLLLSAAATAAAFVAIESIEFIRTGGLSEPASANGIPVLLLGTLGLLVVVIKSSKLSASVIGAVGAIAVIGFGGFLQLTGNSGYGWAEYRQVPAIVEVESQRFELSTLMISQSGEAVYLRQGNGMNLGEQSILAELLAPRDGSADESIASLSASLIASNSNGVQPAMNELSVAFVQLEGDNPTIASQLSRLPELTFAGQTAEGALWRADSTELEDRRIQLNLVQLVPWAAIVLTLLIAIPTPASIRGRARIRGIR